MIGRHVAIAQQDPQFSMYMFNRLVLNPAYAGTAGGTQLTAVGRSQWVGIDGHPVTFTASGSTPVYALRGALGGYIMHDRIGPFTATTLRAAYAFRIPLGESGNAIQIGINPGLAFRNLDGTQWRLDPSNPTDPALPVGTYNQTQFTLGAGATFTMADDKLWVGIAADHLTEPALSNFTSTGSSKIARSFNLTAGYKFYLNQARSMSLVPSTMLKLTGPQFQADFNLNFNVSPMVFGVSYRLNDAIIGIMGFNATKELFVGYSYDYTLSGLGQATSGSHEVVISYTFPPVFKLRPPDLGVRDKKSFR